MEGDETRGQRFQCAYCGHEGRCRVSMSDVALALVRCPACHRRDVEAVTSYWSLIAQRGVAIVLATALTGLLLYGEQDDEVALLLSLGLGLGALMLVVHLGAQRFERLEAAVRFLDTDAG